MAREYGKALTKQMLIDWGITDIHWDEASNQWYVNRYWYKNKSINKINKRLSIQNAVCKHKYTNDKSYPIITFSYNQKVITLPLSRVIYVWFKGDVADKEVVDHINNNPYDNRPDNLQVLSVGENLAKRFVDNARCNANQYTTKVYKTSQTDLAKFVHDIKINGGSYELAVVLTAKYNIEENKGEN